MLMPIQSRLPHVTPSNLHPNHSIANQTENWHRQFDGRNTVYETGFKEIFT